MSPKPPSPDPWETTSKPFDGSLSRRTLVVAAATGGLMFAAGITPSAAHADALKGSTQAQSALLSASAFSKGPDMPTYVCNTQNANLSKTSKAAIAHEIARIHHEVTGAPVFFVQVIFNQLSSDDHYIGGSAQTEPQIFVRGDIRSGRSEVDVQRLLTLLVDGVAAGAGVKPTAVWVYLAELAPTHMAEFGHMLPPAGGESAWLTALPPAERAHMERNGVAAGFTL